MPFQIIHQDITNMDVDCIVNAANKQLLAGGGVCGAIFKKAGYEKLQAECNQLSPIHTGEAVITKGYNLKAKHIIHAVGPIYQDGKHQERKLLENTYKNALELAYQNKLTSIAFPLISGGIYGYPKREALEVARETIRQFLETHEMDVYLALLDRSAIEISKELHLDIQHYIDTYFVETRREYNESVRIASYLEDDNVPSFIRNRPFSFVVEDTFSTHLLKLIDEKGYTDVEVYKRANMSRKLFSKIRSQKDYQPKKQTALSLAVALKLNLDETNELLEKAGYCLSHSKLFDVVIEYFIINEIYDVLIINEYLYEHDLPLLA